MRRIRRVSGKHLVKRCMTAMCMGMLFAGCLTGCTTDKKEPVSSESGETKVLKVGNEEVTQAEAYIYMIQCVYTYGIDESMIQESEKDYRDLILEQVRSSKSKYQVAQTTDIELTEEDKEAVEALVDKYYASFTKELLDEFGVTREALVQLFTEEKYIEKLDEKAKTDLQANYEKEGKEQFSDKAFVDVDYAVFPFVELDSEGNEIKLSEEEKAEQKKKAEAFRQKVLDGGDFEELAKEYGVEDTTDKQRTYIGASGDKMDAILTTLKNGEVAPLYEDDARYMVIRMNNNNDTEYRDFFIQTYSSQMVENAYSTMEKTWLKAMNTSDADFIGDAWDNLDFAGVVKYMQKHGILSAIKEGTTEK